jgi:hypothetical protein
VHCGEDDDGGRVYREERRKIVRKGRGGLQGAGVPVPDVSIPGSTEVTVE